MVRPLSPKNPISRRCVMRAWLLATTLILAIPSACDEAADPAGDFDDQAELEPEGLLGKEDGTGIGSLPVNGNFASTQVWEVRNQWEDINTADAKLAGMAWGENSGLNWDEKFAAWVGSLEKTEALRYGDTFALTTPFGRSLPAPILDCADVALILRASFAAWYNLPFYMSAFGGGERIFFGHFGIRTKNGIWNNMPKFANAYKDFSGDTPAEFDGEWPQDSLLRKRGIQKGDNQPFLDNLRTGAYLDELHLNKRAGHFIRLLLIFTGSPHLADSRNTYNLVPEALRAGDTLLYRRARQGSGHTMVVMRATDLGFGKMETEIAYGNIPPAQPAWEEPGAAKRRFTHNEGGGPTMNSVGETYSHIGGGIKRWRVAKKIGSKWTNTWMKADEASWINDRDYDRIAARPSQFDALLGEVTPEVRRDLLVEVIETKRRHLRSYPASCSAREGREEAFNDLYAVMAEEFDMDKATVDGTYRIFQDYVFAELDYQHAKTCCWNSTTAAMHDIAIAYNEGLQDNACAEPVVFKAVGGAYDIFARYAEEIGRGDEWVKWTEDETCPQRDTLEDVETDHVWTPWCELGSDVTPPVEGCVPDSFEDNDSAAAAKPITAGTHAVTACGGDDDYYTVEGTGGQLFFTMEFSHAVGDLDMAVYVGEKKVGTSDSSTDIEEIDLKTEAGTTYTLRVFGYRGAEAPYTLTVVQD
ncbi:MAG: hypothetical protein ACI9MR_003222 [Myxococcota bacterium]|jgi:hypothetical protein